jgi:prevent-host-death family protein
MNKTISLSEARKNLPELARSASSGNTFVVSRRGRELAVLIGVDEYQRLKAIEQQQRQRDFDILLVPPDAAVMTEEKARELAVQIVRERRSRHA